MMMIDFTLMNIFNPPSLILRLLRCRLFLAGIWLILLDSGYKPAGMTVAGFAGMTMCAITGMTVCSSTGIGLCAGTGKSLHNDC